MRRIAVARDRPERVVAAPAQRRRGDGVEPHRHRRPHRRCRPGPDRLRHQSRDGASARSTTPPTSIAGDREPYLVDVPADGSRVHRRSRRHGRVSRAGLDRPAASSRMLEQRYLSLDRRDPARHGAGRRHRRSARPPPRAMLAERTGDGPAVSFRFTPGTEPGQWRPELPAFGNDPAGLAGADAPVPARRAAISSARRDRMHSRATSTQRTSAEVKRDRPRRRRLPARDAETRRTSPASGTRTRWRLWSPDLPRCWPTSGSRATSTARATTSPCSTSRRPTASSPAGTRRRAGASGGRSRRSARRPRTAIRRPPRIRTGSRCSTRRPTRTIRRATRA